MTNNIEKLYELAKATKYRAVSIHNPIIRYGDYDNLDDVIKYDDGFDIEKIFPPFTAEKQLELIKWIAKNLTFGVLIHSYDNKFRFSIIKNRARCHKYFSQALAGLVCELWENLTDMQREEIRGILQ